MPRIESLIDGFDSVEKRIDAISGFFSSERPLPDGLQTADSNFLANLENDESSILDTQKKLGDKLGQDYQSFIDEHAPNIGRTVLMSNDKSINDSKVGRNYIIVERSASGMVILKSNVMASEQARMDASPDTIAFVDGQYLQVHRSDMTAWRNELEALKQSKSLTDVTYLEKKCRESTVFLEVKLASGFGGGTGVIVGSPDGRSHYILTNAHNVKGMADSKVEVTTHDGRKHSGEVFAVSSDGRDLAVVKINSPLSYPVSKIANGNAVPGQSIATYGFPSRVEKSDMLTDKLGAVMNFGSYGKENLADMVYSFRDIAEQSRSEGLTGIGHKLSTSPGNSGAGVFNTGTAEVVGIASAGLSSEAFGAPLSTATKDRYTMIIPASEIHDFLNKDVFPKLTR
jgi:S1-C subfamily serine protease